MGLVPTAQAQSVPKSLEEGGSDALQRVPVIAKATFVRLGRRRIGSYRGMLERLRSTARNAAANLERQKRFRCPRFGNWHSLTQTGKRLRDLPLSPEQVKTALK
jgi:hypothetical protein